MLQLTGNPCLADEALLGVLAHLIATQGDFHGQRPLKHFIGHPHHLAHAASGNLALKAVTADALWQVIPELFSGRGSGEWLCASFLLARMQGRKVIQLWRHSPFVVLLRRPRLLQQHLPANVTRFEMPLDGGRLRALQRAAARSAATTPGSDVCWQRNPA